jgi:hypothetical protein
MSFTVADGKIAEIDTIADPERVRRIAAAVLTAETATAGRRTSEGANGGR